jgi:hypothetical protein
MAPEMLSLSIMPALGALALGFTVWAERYLLTEKVKALPIEQTGEIRTRDLPPSESPLE